MPPSSSDLAGLHILIVDDDDTFLDLIEAILKSLGAARVTRAKNGSDAFVRVAKIDKVVDCILCDYTMSPGNGLQLLQAIRTGQVKAMRPDSCFVLVTATGDPQVVNVAVQLDVNGYLVKPATPDKLRTTIVKARSRHFPVNIEKYVSVVLPLA